MYYTVVMAEEERYSNRQIERMLENQTHDLKEHMSNLTAPILAQVLKTNGRMNKAEQDIVNQKVWRGWQNGAIAVLGVFFPIILGILTFLTMRVLNIDATVRTSIDELRRDYVLPVTK
jgi:hypothetical protein